MADWIIVTEILFIEAICVNSVKHQQTCHVLLLGRKHTYLSFWTDFTHWNKQYQKFLKLALKALTAFVEAVQLQNIPGTHFQSLTNNILERRIFGDDRFLTAIAECILAVVHHWPEVIWDSVGGASALVNKFKIPLTT